MEGCAGAAFWAREGSATREAPKRKRGKRFRVIEFVFSVSHATETRSKAKKAGVSKKSSAQKVRCRGGGEGFRKKEIATIPYFCNYRNMKKADPLVVTRCADRFSAISAEPRLPILRLLLSAHPTGMVAGELQEEVGSPASTVAHDLGEFGHVGLSG